MKFFERRSEGVPSEQRIRDLLESLDPVDSRFELWTRFLNSIRARRVAEVGVWKGEFAEVVLRECPQIESYLMIDPWRHLDDWNKPFNVEQPKFEEVYAEAMARTEFARCRTQTLRGKTTEVAGNIADGSLDFAYIDGDHTLKGISIDLVAMYQKVAKGGFLGGDDFSPSIWGHSEEFEPTFVFPFAVYFAEAVGDTIYALPHDQFLIHKGTGFRFEDRTGRYGDISILGQLKRVSS